MVRRLVLGFAFALALSSAASACPNCKEAIAEQSSDAGNQKDGYSYGVMMMLAMPFALLGFGTIKILRAVKRGALPEL
jgi:hypothetical protein